MQNEPPRDDGRRAREVPELQDEHPESLERGATDPVRWAFLTGVHLLRAGRASLLLRSADVDVLRIAASIGIDPLVVAQIRVVVGEGIAGIVAERGGHFFGRRGETTFLSVPVRTDRGVEGVLSMTERLGGGQFGEEELAQANVLADHIAGLLTYDRFASHDLASGLPNRQAFVDMVERELARSKRTGGPFAIGSVRVDIKQSGAAQDVILRGIGNALQGAQRRYDYTAHFGAGEFGMLFALPLATTAGLDTRIRTTIAGAVRSLQAEADVAVGIALCPEDGMDAWQLIAAAHHRLDGSGSAAEVSR